MNFQPALFKGRLFQHQTVLTVRIRAKETNYESGQDRGGFGKFLRRSGLDPAGGGEKIVSLGLE